MIVSLGLDEADAQRQQLDVYKESFQTPFLEATKHYYQAESKAFVSSNSVPDYMKKAEDRLQEEADRVNMYLNDTTMKEASCKSNSQILCADGVAQGEMRGGFDHGSRRYDHRRIPTLAGPGSYGR